MTWSYAPGDGGVGTARLLVPDRIEAEAIFSDEEYVAFLALEGGPQRAAAAALETIASDQALVLKVLRLGNLTTDGSKLSDALLARAAKLRGQADDADAASGDAFDWAEMGLTPANTRERIWNQALRGAL